MEASMGSCHVLYMTESLFYTDIIPLNQCRLALFTMGCHVFFALADGVREVSKVKKNMCYAYSHILKCNTPTCISIYLDRV